MELLVCDKCHQEITNPICPKCLGREIKIWLKEKSPKMQRIVGPYSRFPSAKGIFCGKCIFCGDEIGICAHCVTKDVYLKLIEKKPKLGEEFISCFNYELREDFE